MAILSLLLSLLCLVFFAFVDGASVPALVNTCDELSELIIHTDGTACDAVKTGCAAASVSRSTYYTTTCDGKQAICYAGPSDLSGAIADCLAGEEQYAEPEALCCRLSNIENNHKPTLEPRPTTLPTTSQKPTTPLSTSSAPTKPNCNSSRSAVSSPNSGNVSYIAEAEARENGSSSQPADCVNDNSSSSVPSTEASTSAMQTTTTSSPSSSQSMITSQTPTTSSAPTSAATGTNAPGTQGVSTPTALTSVPTSGKGSTQDDRNQPTSNGSAGTSKSDSETGTSAPSSPATPSTTSTTISVGISNHTNLTPWLIVLTMYFLIMA